MKIQGRFGDCKNPNCPESALFRYRNARSELIAGAWKAHMVKRGLNV